MPIVEHIEVEKGNKRHERYIKVTYKVVTPSSAIDQIVCQFCLYRHQLTKHTRATQTQTHTV